MGTPWRMFRIALTALAVSALAAACMHRNPDLNNVVDPYWEKEYFNPDDVWHYKATIIDTAPGNAIWGTVGDGTWLLAERVRWEITEHFLIGHRDFAPAQGSDGDQWEGAHPFYKGGPVAIFPITDHFDIRRTYDPVTGEETNVIAENRERPWYERQYMRVDWSRNLAPVMNFAITLQQVFSPATYVVQNDDPGNPKRYRFDDEYFEVTSRGMFQPDIYALNGYFGPAYYYDTAATLMDIRHSFAKVDPQVEAAFEPVHMPPSVVLEDEEGNEIRDENGYAVRIPVADRFGFFGTLGRNLWDPDRGFTYAGQQYLATVFQIWERSVREDGTVIPIEEREPKPIVYYTNVEHPKQLLPAAMRVGAEWDKAFREVVFYAQPGRWSSVDEVPEMFIVRENDCNVENVRSILAELPEEIVARVTAAAAKEDFDGTIESVRRRYNRANDPKNDEPFTVRTAEETQALEDLKRICSALEYYTDPAISQNSSIAPFTWQRVGDIRYNMINAVMQDHQGGWLGLGPMHGDPKTGRTVSAVANLAVKHLDLAVERIVQMVDTLNGLVTLGDVVYGLDVQRYMAEKMARSQQLATFEPSEKLREAMERRLGDLRAGEEALREMSPGAPERRWERLKGTRLEHMLIAPEDALVFGGADPALLAQGDVTLDEALLEQISPLRGRKDLRWEVREAQIHRMGERAMDAPEFIDRFIFGLAMRFQDIEDRRERFEKIREELYVAVQLHEVGHNVGLFHNFAASTDALNYGPRFWELQKLPADMTAARGVVDSQEDVALLDRCIEEQDRLRTEYGVDITFTTQECLGQTETMYASIMDYHGTRNGDFNGLGMYDKAAIKFAYGKLVEVFPEDKLIADPASTDIERWTYLNDWRDIPTAIVDGYEAVSERDHIRWEWGPASTRMPLPKNTVPYRFCWGGPSGDTPWCQVFDFGPDMRTNAALLETRYYQYYFWSHFARDRLWEWPFGLFDAMQSDQMVMADFTKKMQWYVFLKATDPEFTGSYAERDFLATTIMGLNFLSHVLGHPASGDFATVPAALAEYYTDLPPTEDRLGDSQILFPLDFLSFCEANAVVNRSGGVVTGPKPGRIHTNIPLGDGRPFFIGLTEDYEEWYLRYIGTYWAKWDALYYLGYNFAWFPRSTYLVDPRVFDISWYRLFPEEVSQMIYAVSTGKDHLLGPVVDANGNYFPRNAIDPLTGEAPDYTGFAHALPSIAFNHQYTAIAVAHVFMSSPFDDTTDLLKSFKVAVQGADDDFATFDEVIAEAQARGEDPSDSVAEFVHPVTGMRIRALKSGDYPVAYDLVKRANVTKERYLRLDACVNDPSVAATDPYCACVDVVTKQPNGNLVCSDFHLEAPGTGECAWYDLERRRDAALERMEDVVDFIDDVRLYNRIYSEW